MLRNARIALVGSLLVALSAGGVWAQGVQGDFEFAFRAAPNLPAPDLGPSQIRYPPIADPLALDCMENDGARWIGCARGSSRCDCAGRLLRTVEQLDPGVTSGAQSWQMSLTASGCDGIILNVTATQTDVAPGDIAFCEFGRSDSGGLEFSELATGLGIDGAVHVTVLHLTKGTTLDPTGLNPPHYRSGAEPRDRPPVSCRVHGSGHVGRLVRFDATVRCWP
jgi:hypothetical protein